MLFGICNILTIITIKFQNIFITTKRKSRPAAVTPVPSSPQPPATTNPLSVSVDSPSMDIAYKLTPQYVISGCTFHARKCRLKRSYWPAGWVWSGCPSPHTHSAESNLSAKSLCSLERTSKLLGLGLQGLYWKSL